VWGRDDRVLPVRHASNAAMMAPKAKVVVIPNAGHFPHKDHPQRFVKLLNDFVRSHPPARYDVETWRRTLRSGGDPSVQQAEAGERPVSALPSA
jgi:hypothetical protein